MAPPTWSECELIWAVSNWQECCCIVGRACWTALMISWLQTCCQGRDFVSLKAQISVLLSAPSAYRFCACSVSTQTRQQLVSVEIAWWDRVFSCFPFFWLLIWGCRWDSWEGMIFCSLAKNFILLRQNYCVWHWLLPWLVHVFSNLQEKEEGNQHKLPNSFQSLVRGALSGAIDVVGNMDWYCKLFDGTWVGSSICFCL